jgi:hypothetical protein
MRFRFRFLPLLLAWPVAAAGQSQDAHAGHRAPQASLRRVEAYSPRARIIIDGRLQETDWQGAAPARDFTQQSPSPGEPAAQPSEARVLLADDAIYVAVRLFDTAPDSIVAELGRRDALVASDWVHVQFDTYRDGRNAYEFAVNAAGVKRDVRFYEDIQQDVSWDAVWDVATQRDSLGWTAEFRIPLTQLRFAHGPAAQSWGFNITRVLHRRAERSHWSPIRSNTGSLVSSFGELANVHIQHRPRRAELTPFVSSRLLRAEADARDPFRQASEVTGTGGLDLKLGLTPALTLTATANPDFGQVEADPSVVNLTAFENYFPERRPFFVEGAELFRMAGANLFYSRRIGRTPQGSMPAGAQFARAPDYTRILGAVKITGRSSTGWQLGLLEAATAREDARYLDAGDVAREAAVEPGTNYLVGRLARDFQRGRTALSALVTATHRDLHNTELAFLRQAAYTGGLDARHRFHNNTLELAGTLQGSHVLGDTAAIARTQRAAGHYFQRPDAHHLEYDPGRTTLGGYSAQARFGKIAGGNLRYGMYARLTSPGFEVNDVGFHSSNDRVTNHTSIGYYVYQPGRHFRSWSVSAYQNGEWTTGGERIEFNGTAEASFTLHNHWGIAAWAMRHTAGLNPDVLRGGPALYVPAHTMGSISVAADTRRRVSGELGVFFDRNDERNAGTVDVWAQLAWRPSARAQIELTPSYRTSQNGWQYVSRRLVASAPHYVLADLQQRTASMGVRLSYTFAPELSLQLYAQPFVSAGDYGALKALGDAHAHDMTRRLTTYDATQIRTRQTESGLVHDIDADRDGTTDFTQSDPGFNFKQVRSNAVLRWEFRPGSTLFLAWSSDRTRSDPRGDFDLRRDAGRLLAADGRNALLLKVSYWLGF